MNNINISLIQQMVEQISNDTESKPMFVSFTGSVAHGVPTRESDIDIMIVLLENLEVLLGYPDRKNEILKENMRKSYVDENDNKYDIAVITLRDMFRKIVAQSPQLMIALFSTKDIVLYQSRAWDYVENTKRHLLSKTAVDNILLFARAQFAELLKSETNSEYSDVGYSTKLAYVCTTLYGIASQLSKNGIIDVSLYKTQTIADIREGKYTFKEIKELIAAEKEYAEIALSGSKLPEKIDMKHVQVIALSSMIVALREEYDYVIEMNENDIVDN